MLSISTRSDGFDLLVGGRLARRLVATRYGFASSTPEAGQLPLFAQSFWAWTDFFGFRCRVLSLACSELYERYEQENAYRVAASRAAPQNRQALEQAKEVWNRFKAKAPAGVLTLQRAVKRMSGPTYGDLLEQPELYDGYLGKDLVAVPGAAAMVGVVELLVEERPSVRVFDPPSDDEPWFGSGCWRWVAPPPPPLSKRLAALEGWAGLCAPDAGPGSPGGDTLTPGTPYRSLSRTLARLPAGLSPSCVVGLRSVRLERPLTSKLSIAAVSAIANPSEVGPFDLDDSGKERRLVAVRRLMHASHDDLTRLVADTSRLAARRLSPRRARDIGCVVGLVTSAAVSHRGPLRTLVRKAFLEGRAPKPPIPPPDLPGVRMLSTAEEVAEEGRAMRHCVANRTQDLLAGRIFLLAVRRGGCRATVEVNARGEVTQSRGPANSENAASRWGREACHRWAEPLRARANRSRERAGDAKTLVR